MKKNIISTTFILLRRTIYVLLGRIDKAFKRKNNLVVLCYHSIEEDNWGFSVSPADFKKQIKFMLENYEHVEFDGLIKGLESDSNSIAPSFLLTFDDGYENLVDIVPFLKKNGINPMLFAISDRKNVQRENLKTQKELLSDEKLRELTKLGWYVESHGKTHFKLENATATIARNEIEASKAELEKILEKKVIYFSYPHGEYTPETIELIKSSGYKAAFSLDDMIIRAGVNIFAVPRIGVNKTHSFEEFKYLASPSVITFRRFAKQIFPVTFI